MNGWMFCGCSGYDEVVDFFFFLFAVMTGFQLPVVVEDSDSSTINAQKQIGDASICWCCCGGDGGFAGQDFEPGRRL
jgi:hypothetical protein